MPVADDRTPRLERQTAAADSDRAAQPCPFCTRLFRPKKPNQLYCSPKHRRQALLVRQRADRLVQGTKRPPQRTAAALWRLVHQERRRQNLPQLERQEFLAARARVIEAQGQIEHWTRLLRAREALFESLPSPCITAQYTRLAPGQRFTPDPRATYCEIVGSDGLVIVALGFKRA